MPAEWEPHEQCWMGFPADRGTWYGASQFPAAQEAFAALARTIASFEPVTLCVPAALWQRAHALLGFGEGGAEGGSAVRIVEMAQNAGAWLRDQAPIFVYRRKGTKIALVGVDWEFDAWGGVCYPDWREDACIGRKICALERLPVLRPGMVLEGGSVRGWMRNSPNNR
jgi:agmatine deiminase